MPGIFSLSKEPRQSIFDGKFEIDHTTSLKSHGIKKLKKGPIPPIYKGVDGINTYGVYPAYILWYTVFPSTRIPQNKTNNLALHFCHKRRERRSFSSYLNLSLLVFWLPFSETNLFLSIMLSRLVSITVLIIGIFPDSFSPLSSPIRCKYLRVSAYFPWPNWLMVALENNPISLLYRKYEQCQRKFVSGPG